MQVMHLVALEADHSHDFRVATSANFVANEELIDKLVIAVQAQTHLISEVHRRIEELLIRQLHRCINRLYLHGRECCAAVQGRL